MYALYFIAAIAALVALISYAIGRINKQSYLHAPLKFPSFSKAREEALAEPSEEKQLSRSEQHEQAYVEWYTQRNTAIHHKREPKPIEKREAFVGVAVVHEEPVDDAAPARPESNIDRWYRKTVNAW